MLADQADHVLGVDTHRDTHSIAVLAADTAVVQRQITLAANERGYQGCCASRARMPQAAVLGRSRGPVATVLDSPRSCPSKASRLEVDRPKRPARRDQAKSDELDAIRAARQALSREHLAQPRLRGEREALRVLLATQESAIRSSERLPRC